MVIAGNKPAYSSTQPSAKASFLSGGGLCHLPLGGVQGNTTIFFHNLFVFGLLGILLGFSGKFLSVHRPISGRYEAKESQSACDACGYVWLSELTNLLSGDKPTSQTTPSTSQRNTGEVFSFFGLSIIVARAQNAQLGSATRRKPFSLFGLSTQRRAMLNVGLGC